MSTIVDVVSALELLKKYEVHVARSRYVDSAEDAIAFSERRNAPDPRFVPIVLRVAVPGRLGEASQFETILTTEQDVRTQYDALAGAARASGGRLLAQALPERGTDIAIVGETDEGQKLVAIGSGPDRMRKSVPLGAADAQVLADRVRAHHHRVPTEQSRRMLVHVFARISKLLDETAVSEFVVTLRAHENGYTVIDAMMSALRPLHFKERLDPRAHDRKGDDYHPSGRQ
ncbi:MAG: hypothetical protein ACYC8W_02595 [Candidatus Tyrphobacter sp.]